MKAQSLPNCPFCGKSLAYSLDYAHNPDGGVIHGILTCETFDKLNPLEFITAVRNKLQTDRGIS